MACREVLSLEQFEEVVAELVDDALIGMGIDGDVHVEATQDSEDDVGYAVVEVEGEDFNFSVTYSFWNPPTSMLANLTADRCIAECLFEYMHQTALPAIRDELKLDTNYPDIEVFLDYDEALQVSTLTVSVQRADDDVYGDVTVSVPKLGCLHQYTDWVRLVIEVIIRGEVGEVVL
jgi:hypothetical protein